MWWLPLLVKMGMQERHSQRERHELTKPLRSHQELQDHSEAPQLAS